MSNIDKQPFRADGGDISTGRLKEIADNPYGDEEKCWLAKRVLALLASLEAEPVSFDELNAAVAEVTGANEHSWNLALYKGHHPVPFMNYNSLARIVDKYRTAPQAPIEAKPVAWISERNLKNLGKSYSVYVKHEPVMVRPIPLYTAPPEPVVPEEATPENIEILASTYAPSGVTYQWDEDERNAAADAWNACRAAMLKDAKPVTTAYKFPEEIGSSLQLRNLIRECHAEWSQATFGDVGPVGPLKHLSKEALEAAAEPDDLSEWADMQFLLWDAQRRAGISDGEITAAMEEKLKVNIARQWPEPKDGEPRYHVKGK